MSTIVDQREIEQRRKAGVKTALALLGLAALVYLGFIGLAVLGQ